MLPISIELLILGFLVGGFGTLIGAGGGFILVPVLALIFPNLSPNVITSISLFTIFLNAFSGSIAYGRMKRIDYRSGIVFGIATLPGSIAGVFLTGYIKRALFDVILGCVLMVIAIFLFIKPGAGAYATRKPHKINTTRNITDAAGNNYVYAFNIKQGTVLSFFVGFLSSFLGIGVGIIHVPALISLLDFPAHIATATSHFVLAIMAFVATIVHIMNGTLQHGWRTALYLGTGVVIGAQPGAHFSNKVKPTAIIKALAIALIVVGIRLVFF